MEEALQREELERENRRLRAQLEELERRGAVLEDAPAVGQWLRQHRERVLHTWMARVRGDSDIARSQLDSAALRSHVPQLLDELARALTHRHLDPSAAAAIGRRVWSSEVSVEHARERFDHGYSLGDVLRELSTFRATLREMLERDHIVMSAAAACLVHSAIDEAMTIASTQLEQVAHASVERSEERYRGVLEGSARDDAILLLDVEGRISSWSPSAERMTGYVADEVLGRFFPDVFRRDEILPGEHARVLAEARMRGHIEGRRRCRRKDGSIYWALLAVTPMRGSQGEHRGYVKVMRDITAQVESEVALAATEARLAAILASAMDGIVTIDADHRIVLFNRAAEEIFGCPASDALGTPLARFLPVPIRAPRGEHDAPLEAGAGPRGVGSIGRLVARRADGSPVPIEATISHAEVAGSTYYTAVVRDVSERVRAEQAREELQARLEAINDHASAAIFQKDLEGRYALVNRRFLEVHGMRLEAVIGRTDAELFSPEIARAYQSNDREVLAQGRAIHVEEPVAAVDGLRTHLSVKFPLRDVHGALFGVGGVSTDITEAARVRDALAREAHLRELFVGVLAHDLRTPLYAIVMSSSVLLHRTDLHETARAFVVRISNGARRMTSLCEELLDFTRARHGGLPMQPRPADLDEICRRVLDEVMAAHPERTVVGQFGSRVVGEWDPERLAQVVSNLLSNAIAHGREGSPIVVSTRSHDDHVELVVQNQNAGQPITPEQRETLFDPFFRGPRVVGRGLGLGLYIVDQIVRAHGGEIDVESSVEAGTSFTVRLPLRAPRVGSGRPPAG